MNENKNSDRIEDIKKKTDVKGFDDGDEEIINFDRKEEYNQEKWRHVPGNRLVPSIYFKQYAKYLNIHKSADKFVRSLNGRYVPSSISKFRHLILSDHDTGVMILTDKFAIFTYCIRNTGKEMKSRHEYRNVVVVLRSTWPWNAYAIFGAKKFRVHDARNHVVAMECSDEARRFVEMLSSHIYEDDEERSAREIKEFLDKKQ